MVSSPLRLPQSAETEEDAEQEPDTDQALLGGAGNSHVCKCVGVSVFS